ncbi:MAG: hypothetical protein NZM11_03560 [Anaerolineales bacterium]|nr:hypothetical protein [Anaerolineales bacterium]
MTLARLQYHSTPRRRLAERVVLLPTLHYEEQTNEDLPPFELAHPGRITPGPRRADRHNSAAATGQAAEILARGTLIISTNPAYPPRSELKPGGPAHRRLRH